MGRLQLCGLCMAPVPELLLLLILLWATSHSGDAALGPARDQGSPISDLRLHPRLKMLTWTCRRPAIPQACVVDAPGHPPVCTTPRALDDDTYFCSFPNLVLHRGASFEVHTVLGGATFQEALRFDNPGRVGASAANLSCVIYEVQSMNCSWLPGRTAPRDTVYRLFFWFDPKEAEAECPQYLLDSKGLRVGCHFTRLGGEPKTSDNYFFLVNGTSSEATIPFLDTLPFVAFLIEKYTPPANVSVSPAGMGFVVHWDNPARRFDQSPSTLFYEVDIRRKGDAAETQPVFQRGQERNAHALAAGTAGSSVRVRVRHLRGAVWSEWSAARDVGADRDRGGGGGGLALARVLALVAAVALCTAALAVVCKRCRLQQRLLPPVPQVKDELRGVFAAAQEASHRERGRARSGLPGAGGRPDGGGGGDPLTLPGCPGPRTPALRAALSPPLPLRRPKRRLDLGPNFTPGRPRQEDLKLQPSPGHSVTRRGPGFSSRDKLEIKRKSSSFTKVQTRELCSGVSAGQPALRRPRREDLCRSEAHLGCMTRSCLKTDAAGPGELSGAVRPASPRSRVRALVSKKRVLLETDAETRKSSRAHRVGGLGLPASASRVLRAARPCWAFSLG